MSPWSPSRRTDRAASSVPPMRPPMALGLQPGMTRRPCTGAGAEAPRRRGQLRRRTRRASCGLPAGASAIRPSSPPIRRTGSVIDIAGAAHLFGGEDRLDRRPRSPACSAKGIAARAAVADRAGRRLGGGALRQRPGRRAGPDGRGGGEPAGRRLCASPPTSSTPCTASGSSASGNSRPCRARRWRAVSARMSPCGSIRPSAMPSSRSSPLVPQETPSRRLAFRRADRPARRPQAGRRFVSPNDLCRRSRRRGLGVRRLDLIFRRVDRSSAGPAGRHRPRRRGMPRILQGSSTSMLGTIDPGFGIEETPPVASQVEPLSERTGRGGRDRARRRCTRTSSRLVDRLGARLGPQTDLPPRAGREPRARALGAARPRACAAPAGCLARHSAAPGAPPRPARAGRRRRRCCPTIRRRFFVWRRVRHRVVKADGPERITGEWWRSEREVSACRATITASRPTRVRALLALPRRAGRRGRALVAARAFRMSEAIACLCGAPGHDAFLVPARRLEPARAVRAGEAPRHCPRSASPTATRSPASCAPMRPRRRPACASSSAAASIWPTAPRSSSTRPTAPPIRACAACSASARAGPGKGQMRASAGRTSRPGTRASSPCCSATRRTRRSRPICSG